MEVKQFPRIILRGDEEAASYMSREGMRQLDILKNLMSFRNLKQDVRRVRFINGSEIICRSIFGIEDIQIYAPKREIEVEITSKSYVYVTISDYVTIWDLKTGEVAEDICNNNGEVYDDAGNPLVTFPCHKDELVTWLKGIKDRPTRQVPETEDNEKDIGNENRVLCEYGGCFGIVPPGNFTNLVHGESVWPWFTPDGITYWKYIFSEKDSPVGYPESLSWHQNYKGHELVMEDPSGDEKWWQGYDYGGRYFLDIYKPRSRHLRLCPWPMNPLSLECNNYEAVEMISKKAHINYMFTYLEVGVQYPGTYSPIYRASMFSDIYSYKAPLGELIIDFIPRKKLEEKYSDLDDYTTFQETLRLYPGLRLNEFYTDVFDKPIMPVVDAHIANNNLDEELAKYIINAYPSEAQVVWFDTVHPLPPDWITRCVGTTKRNLPLHESNRYGVSWCEQHPDRVQNVPWYKIKLFFYTGKITHTERDVSYGIDQSEVVEFDIKTGWITKLDCPSGGETTVVYDRFSSVQATIELEHPEIYPKKKNIFILEKPDWVKRYRRPEDYSSLCVFPYRECGYPEDEENNICFPFDGTYDIYTLGEAVEELLNDHYEDGSNDQLLVYLLEKPTTVSDLE